MTDRNMIEGTIALNQSYLSKEEQEEVYDLLVKCKGAFSLRNEVGTCPNIEEDLQVTDKFLLCIRPFQVTEENKHMIDKEMQRLVLLYILKQKMSQ